jgi:hypothetical protein
LFLAKQYLDDEWRQSIDKLIHVACSYFYARLFFHIQNRTRKVIEIWIAYFYIIGIKPLSMVDAEMEIASKTNFALH